MSEFNLHQVREQSPWMTLTLAVFIAAGTIGLTLLSSASSQAAEPGTALVLPGEYKSPQQCRECHAEEFQAWSHTAHADASFDPVFQVALQQVAEPGECFSCHTTGYDTMTGHFVLSGVTCEACHGPYRPGHADHPEDSMVVAGSEELCGACHTSTRTEWVSSQHYTAGVTCVECHEVHTQETQVSDTRNALCAECHRDQTRDTTHAVHLEAGIYCVDCHMAAPEQAAADALRGQVVTGHAFGVYLSACDDCHSLTLEPSSLGLH